MTCFPTQGKSKISPAKQSPNITACMTFFSIIFFLNRRFNCYKIVAL
ncbi:hypothetical protein HMPREF1054_1165 [Haemophilus paraphrohaemolyticus HK411]|uniref:Uncharacterized protein n=1 Tax=Haemophilus paraphrohaemolyticus HK411 TaxID=1095743 RepID=I2NNB9_9PAST|nr:hypothetical protein HMPREF1054_1165 [Haemophilus paraphrohaemolyticus HK411]